VLPLGEFRLDLHRAKGAFGGREIFGRPEGFEGVSKNPAEPASEEEETVSERQRKYWGRSTTNLK
jgi:hypothetical protein